MFRTFFLLFVNSCLFCAIHLPSPIRSGAAVLMDAETGTVIYEKNGSQVLPPASITKLATALYALQFGADLDTKIRATKESLITQTKKVRVEREFSDPPYWLQSDGTTIYINEGEFLSLRDLLYADLLCSANEASNVIANALAGNIPDFVEGMNKYLASIGCKNTKFYNPHGIYYPGHVSTPYDFAIIAREALKYPTLRAISGELEHTIPKTNRSPIRHIRQSNFLLRPTSKYYYQYASGMKTGVHDEALFTLVSTAEKEGRQLIAVIFRSPTYSDRYLDSIDLFEAGFAEKKVARVLFSEGQTFFSPKIKGAKKDVKGVILQEAQCEYYPSIEPKLDASIRWHDLKMPVKKGDEIGILDVVDERQGVLKSISIYADENPKGSFSYYLAFILKIGFPSLLAIAALGWWAHRKFGKHLKG
ncbi:MAG: D-alanyl-D-alanine carboxypeptidase [Simkaniaceae bacterium]|nr:D-alanyl-D-alanine carboxypeptidase [Simkaniaceae bacterium]